MLIIVPQCLVVKRSPVRRYDGDSKVFVLLKALQFSHSRYDGMRVSDCGIECLLNSELDRWRIMGPGKFFHRVGWSVALAQLG